MQRPIGVVPRGLGGRLPSVEQILHPQILAGQRRRKLVGLLPRFVVGQLRRQLAQSLALDDLNLGGGVLRRVGDAQIPATDRLDSL